MPTPRSTPSRRACARIIRVADRWRTESFQRLGVTESHLGTANKVERFEQLVTEGLDPAQRGVGDDIPDMRVMAAAAPALPRAMRR